LVQVQVEQVELEVAELGQEAQIKLQETAQLTQAVVAVEVIMMLLMFQAQGDQELLKFGTQAQHRVQPLLELAIPLQLFHQIQCTHLSPLAQSHLLRS
jgi:steroid 5-alpha reductase family enzyme